MTKVMKRNKKEEQKKLAVRVICLTMVVILAVTSLLAVLPSLFDNSDAEYQAQLQAMVEAGMGICILPELLRSNRENVDWYPMEEPSFREIGLSISSLRSVSPAVKHMIEVIREYVAEL